MISRVCKTFGVALVTGCFSVLAYAQGDAMRLTPLTSTRSQVVAALGQGSVKNDRQTSHNAGGQNVIVTYVSSACAMNDAERADPRVLEVEIIVEKEADQSRLAEIASGYEMARHGRDGAIYWDQDGGNLYVVERQEGVEAVKKIHRLPAATTEVSECNVDSFPETSGLQLLKAVDIPVPNLKTTFGWYPIGTFLESDPEATKDRTLSDFAGAIKGEKDGFGYITLMAGDRESEVAVVSRRQALAAKLSSHGISCQRYLMIDGGRASGAAFYHFYIVNRKTVSKDVLDSSCKQ